jgi:tetratricopeptide (TPR) repeat protein
MRPVLLATAIIVLFASAATLARADNANLLDQARSLFAAGDYLPAADRARAQGSAEGLALATQITCYYGRYLAPEEERLGLYEGAIEMAAAALELDPDNAFVRVQNAHALGRYSQQIGVVEAISEGLAGRMRDQIDAALALEPDNAAAHMLLANWHAAIINNSGFIGRMIYGAEEDEVFTHYGEAIRVSPEDAQIRIEFARAVLELDEDDNSALAQDQLDIALALPAATAFAEVLRGEAAALLESLE